MTRLALRKAPYQIFHGTRTPPELYARQKWLQQEGDAQWGHDFDVTVGELYQGQAANALAHLDFDAADAQCRKAFKLLVEIQNADGSRGETEPEWCTFLVIHALRNKGAI